MQKIHVGAYLMKQRLKRNKRYPLVLMLEPLFRCNLACAGCGKIDYPDPILNKRRRCRMPRAVDECGAPGASRRRALLHWSRRDQGASSRKKYVILCTNALLLEKSCICSHRRPT
jgi:hypothetical protein